MLPLWAVLLNAFYDLPTGDTSLDQTVFIQKNGFRAVRRVIDFRITGYVGLSITLVL